MTHPLTTLCSAINLMRHYSSPHSSPGSLNSLVTCGYLNPSNSDLHLSFLILSTIYIEHLLLYSSTYSIWLLKVLCYHLSYKYIISFPTFTTIERHEIPDIIEKAGVNNGGPRGFSFSYLFGLKRGAKLQPSKKVQKSRQED